MDIVLGVSLTPKTVRMVLVEGEKGDGAIVDHDTFDVSGGEGSATANVTDELVSAVLGTQESATEGGHVLKAIGVTWSDRTEAAALRDGLTARGITDVMLVSELHAAGALAQAAGRAVGYESTGLLFIDRDTATLSVVRSDDGSIVKVLSRSLHSTDALAVLADMVAAVERQDTSPQGMFVVGAGVDIASVKAHLADLVSIPVNAPEESGLALARGAALAAANAPAFDATTAGLAYALDPDGATAGNESVGLANASTQMAPVGGVVPVAAAAPYQAYSDVDPAYDDLEVDDPRVEEGRKPFLLVGSALTSIFVLGVVALVISLAVSIRPTADQRPSPGQAAIIPSVVPPAAPPVPEAAKPAAPAPPPAETIKAPVPVVQQAPAAPPRTVFVEPPQAPAPAPAAPPPAPAAPPPAPPVVAPVVPPVAVPPVWQPPVWQPPVQQRPIWQPPWQQQWPQRPPRDYDDYQPQRPPWQPPWQPPQQTQDPEPPVWQPPWQPQRPSRDEPEYDWPSQDNGNGNDNRNGNGNGSGRGSSEGSGGSQAPGANCFLIFCS
ncbi:MAG: rane protein [Mycobacterium sp.]|nr:rane protein [Mycobacterium sp.]